MIACLTASSLLKEKKISHRFDGLASAKTASTAFASIIKLVKKFDRHAKLKMIVSPDGVDRDGASFRWEYFFDLPKLQAKLVCDWHVQNDHNNIAVERADIAVTPFPPADNVIRQMVDEGKLLYPQLKGMWRKELVRTPDIPYSFYDSSVAIVDLVTLGLTPLDMEFSLVTGTGPDGNLSWIAQTRDNKIYTKLI